MWCCARWPGSPAAGLARRWPICPRRERAWIGIALLPQAGVAIGMALVAGQQFPEHAEAILTLTVATTVIFEVFGPIGTLAALRRLDPKGEPAAPASGPD